MARTIQIRITRGLSYHCKPLSLIHIYGTLWCSWRADVGAGMSYARYSQDGAELCSFGPEAFPEAPSLSLIHI